ncbi:MAG TPA: MoaD/ThiS family protein, partial [Pyrinomonadaceae bacterium]
MTQETHGQSEAGEPREVRVHVLFFGAAREAAADEAVLALGAGTTARAAFARVLEEYPDLVRFRSSLLVAVNQEYARDLEVELEDGDELALFPPVSGGDGEPPEADDAEDFFELTTEPVDVGS